MTGSSPTGASATPRSAELPPLRRVAVAASGGLDSTALLHCTVRAARAWGVQVFALHVNHGLHPDADSWRRRLGAQVARWARAGGPVAFRWQALAGAPAPGESVEAWARAGRYAALTAMATELRCGLVLLAQHRHDQAETVLLQALRGAGAAGGSAMPAVVERSGLTWARPWLDQPREAIERYAARHRLGFVEDPGNVDRRFARNRLRHDVWPVLQAAFPDAEAALAASARRSAEAQQCLLELHALDSQACVREEVLDVAAWLQLSLARRGHLLRRFLADTRVAAVPETLVQRLLREVPGRRTGRWPLGRATVQLHGGRLAVVPAQLRGEADFPRGSLTLDLSRPGRHRLPGWGGALRVARHAQAGLPPALLTQVFCAPRQGGERFCAGPDRPPRALKKQFQDAGVPAWRRDGPLLFVEGQLLFVPGLGLDARWYARLQPGGLVLSWQPENEPQGDRALG